MNILLTGASGFVGSAVLEKLNKQDHNTIIVTRNKSKTTSINEQVVVKGIDSHTEWGGFLSSIDVVIHAAARVHVMNEVSLDPLEDFREVNTRGTLKLAREAASSGVKRFVFISTIKVMGEMTERGKPFESSSAPITKDAYGLSKLEAESDLMELARKSGMEVVIIRPPLVYGPGVKGNFSKLVKYASRGIPLPFGSINSNLRSLVSIDNLVDLIFTCITHKNARNQIFMVSDGEDMSTAVIYQRLSRSFGRSGFMIHLPLFIYRIFGKLTNKMEVVDRLCSSLQVDITYTKLALEWSPLMSVQDGFHKIAEDFRKNNSND